MVTSITRPIQSQNLNFKGNGAAPGIFQGLSPVADQEIRAKCLPTRVKKGHTLIWDGDRAPYIYIVTEGSLKLFKLSREGKTLVLEFAKPGDTVNEIGAVNDIPSPYTAEAVDDVTLYVLAKADFFGLFAVSCG